MAKLYLSTATDAELHEEAMRLRREARKAAEQRKWDAMWVAYGVPSLDSATSDTAAA